VHGYLSRPGRIPKITRATLTRGPAFVIDFFGEYLLALRRRELRSSVHRLTFNQQLTQRDLVAVERLGCGADQAALPARRAHRWRASRW
jgi:predicted ATP-dependent Lon-type protease